MPEIPFLTWIRVAKALVAYIQNLILAISGRQTAMYRKSTPIVLAATLLAGIAAEPVMAQPDYYTSGYSGRTYEDGYRDGYKRGYRDGSGRARYDDRVYGP